MYSGPNKLVLVLSPPRVKKCTDVGELFSILDRLLFAGQLYTPPLCVCYLCVPTLLGKCMAYKTTLKITSMTTSKAT